MLFSKLKISNCTSKRWIFISTHTPRRVEYAANAITAWSYYTLGIKISQADCYVNCEINVTYFPITISSLTLNTQILKYRIE